MVNALKINVDKNGDHAMMINVVVRMDTVVFRQNFVHFHKDVNQNLVSVLKEDVVNYGDHVLKDNVVVKRDIVELLQDFVPLLKDVK